jgi:Sulfotransferase domain
MKKYSFNEVDCLTTTQYIIASWKYSGANFCRDFIKENFPECFNWELWGKTHSTLSIESYKTISNKNIKIFFILADPRDVSANIGYLRNGWNCDKKDYSDYAYNHRDSLVFLNENLNIINKLLNYYTTKFKDNCLVLRYEDAYYNPDFFLKKVGSFLNLQPLNINDVDKYRQNINRDIGIFPYYYSSNIIDQNYKEYIGFYNQWRYEKNGFHYCGLGNAHKHGSFLNKLGWEGVNNKNRFVEIFDYNVSDPKYINLLNRNKVFSMVIPENPKNGAYGYSNINERIKKIIK